MKKIKIKSIIILLCVFTGCNNSYEKITYDEKGNVLSIVTYNKDNVRHGKFINYVNNGSTRVEGFFKNGKLHGEFVLFDNKGKDTLTYSKYINDTVIEHIVFIDGKRAIKTNYINNTEYHYFKKWKK